jgi:hypothetical protein
MRLFKTEDQAIQEKSIIRTINVNNTRDCEPVPQTAFFGTSHRRNNWTLQEQKWHNLIQRI